MAKKKYEPPKMKVVALNRRKTLLQSSDLPDVIYIIIDEPKNKGDD